MKLQLTISGRAEADLTNQYHWYLTNASLEIAEEFLLAFDSTSKDLTTIPSLGRRRKFRSPSLSGIRSLGIGDGFGSHLIFYRTGAALSKVDGHSDFVVFFGYDRGRDPEISSACAVSSIQTGSVHRGRDSSRASRVFVDAPWRSIGDGK